MDDLWTQLAAPFPRSALTWRVKELSDDGLRAGLRPLLQESAINQRLDAVLGAKGWSNSFAPLGEAALSCSLTLHLEVSVTKAAVASLGHNSAEACAEEALANAAERLGMRPPLDASQRIWVDYDPESRVPLYEPDLGAVMTPAAEAAAELTLAEPSTPAEKPAGQQAIDRLVERLRAAGRGLEAAKLLVDYGGYGTDPDAARELYAKLRALLLEDATGS